QLRGEVEGPALEPSVEGLDAQGIPGQEEAARPPVVEGDGEDPIQAGDQLGAVLLPEMDHHLGVAPAPEGVAVGLEPGPQFPEVVDLTIDHGDDGPVLVPQGERAWR